MYGTLLQGFVPMSSAHCPGCKPSPSWGEGAPMSTPDPLKEGMQKNLPQGFFWKGS